MLKNLVIMFVLGNQQQDIVRQISQLDDSFSQMLVENNKSPKILISMACILLEEETK